MHISIVLHSVQYLCSDGNATVMLTLIISIYHDGDDDGKFDYDDQIHMYPSVAS